MKIFTAGIREKYLTKIIYSIFFEKLNTFHDLVGAVYD